MKDREWKIKKPMLFAEKYGILIFPLTAGILFLLQNTSHTIAGSQIDWISQHTVLAEYFRQRFYSTHEFFPQFASELGGGQNIYNFAYYGFTARWFFCHMRSLFFPWKCGFRSWES